MTLSGERCVACRPGSPKVTAEEESVFTREVPEWELIETNDVRKLRRTFRFTSWMQGVDFARAVALLAEQEDHHPTISISWGKVTITWWTHAIGGLHRNDFIMAAQTDQEWSRSQSG